jgi:RNA polymerase-associated protein RTF1
MLNSGRSSNSAPKLPTPAELEARRIAELNNKNRAQDSVRVRKALIEERRQEKLQRRQREQEYRQKKAEEEAKKKAEEEKAAFKTGIDDLFDGDSRAGTPAAGTPKPAGEKKKEPKGLPTFRKPKMDDDIVASLDLGLEIEI